MSKEVRAMPHNLEAEQAILGAVLLDTRALGTAREILQPEDFFVEAHRFIFRAMVSLSEKNGTAIDAITVGDELGRDLERAGGLGYLDSLVPGLPRSADVTHYASIVKEKAVLRNLVSTGDAIIKSALDRDAKVEAIIEMARSKLESIHTDGADGLRLIRAADIEASPVQWAWEGRVPLGGLTILVGDPGLGKTTLAVELAARLSRGQADGDLSGCPASVVFATAEDALSVLRARLEAAGADMSAVHFVSVVRDQLDVGLTLPDDVAELEREAQAVCARLIIVDPISGHLSGAVDSHRDASLRKALAPLARAAESLDAAVLALAHLNKTEATNLFRRVGGSIALTAAARSVLLLAEDTEGGDLVLVHGKCNLGPLAPGCRLRIESREVESLQGTVATSGIAWLGDVEGLTIADVLTVTEPEERAERDEAADWIVAYLEEQDGEARAVDVFKAGQADGFPKATLQRARKRTGAVTAKAGFHGRWVWRLPEDTDGNPVSQDERSSLPWEETQGLPEGTEDTSTVPSVSSRETHDLSEDTEDTALPDTGKSVPGSGDGGTVEPDEESVDAGVRPRGEAIEI